MVAPDRRTIPQQDFKLVGDEIKWTNGTAAISAEVVELAWRRGP
jgi:hypothetical protein